MDVAATYIDNIKIEGYCGDYIFETIKKTGSFYESDILNKWNSILGKPNIVFDVGSNIGNHAIFWATYWKPATIYAFEPCPINYSRLENNVLNNNLSEIIIPIQKGVGDQEGYASIKNIEESNLGGTSITYITDNIDESAIQIITLDSFVKKNDFNNVDFVKIDTEGFEIRVLQGMYSIIEKYHPDIWVEVSYSTYSEVINTLQKEGYILHDIEQFNLLFLHPSRHIGEISQVDYGKVLDGYFRYLEKTNNYYKAYITSKKWLEERNRTLEQQKKNFQKQIEQLKSDYEQKIMAAKELQDNMSRFLLEDVKVLDNQVDVMERINQYVRKLQTQNSYLIAENQEYRRKFEKITGTWYGRIVLKLYKFLQRVKRGMKGKK